MASGVSLESHMTEISKTMPQLAQAPERIANTQQSNHQTMVYVQQQQANAFEALAATTQQQKYDAMQLSPGMMVKIKKSVQYG